MADALEGFSRSTFTHDGKTRDVYRIGSGPAVIVIAEIPGITPAVCQFARRVAEIGCTAVLPHLFGVPGKPPSVGYMIQSIGPACVSRDFACFALRKTSPVAVWLRALARQAHTGADGCRRRRLHGRPAVAVAELVSKEAPGIDGHAGGDPKAILHLVMAAGEVACGGAQVGVLGGKPRLSPAHGGLETLRECDGGTGGNGCESQPVTTHDHQCTPAPYAAWYLSRHSGEQKCSTWPFTVRVRLTAADT